jgi:hypothetical protein
MTLSYYCECGCGNPCSNRFVKGHNLRVSPDQAPSVEIACMPYEYEASKFWLEEYFDKYYINLRWDYEDPEDREDLRPSEIILTVKKNEEYIVGRGSTFTQSLDSLIQKINIPIIENKIVQEHDQNNNEDDRPYF